MSDKNSKKSENPKTEMPLGLSFGMAMNGEAMENFSRMDKAEKKKLIDQARQVSSKAQMDALISDVAEGKFK